MTYGRGRNRTGSHLLAVLLAGVAAAGAGGADWPQWRGPRVDGVSPDAGWQSRFDDGPPVAWERQVGAGYASVAVAGGRLYTAGWADGHDTIYALDAATGAVVWRHRYAIEAYDNMHVGGPAATPATDGTHVYMASRGGHLICLTAAGGEPVWSKSLAEAYGVAEPTWAFSGSPVLDGNVLYIDVGRILALDKTNGETIWQTDDYGSAYSTPVPFDHKGKRLVAAFPKHGLVLLEAATGREVCKHRWQTQYDVNAATPIVDGDHVFISSGYNTGALLLAFDGQGLTEVWGSKRMRNKMATCVLVDGHLYGIDASVLRCLEFETGAVRWSQRGVGEGTVAAAGDKLIVLTDDGELIIADASPEAFQAHARAKVLEGGQCWTVPVIADGRIYCRSKTGQLVCVDVGGRHEGG